MAAVQTPFTGLYFELPFGSGTLLDPYIGGLFFKNGSAAELATINSGTPSLNRGIPIAQLAGSGLGVMAFGSGGNGATVQRITLATNDALYNRIGEVQAVPTANTVMGRLAEFRDRLNGFGITNETATIPINTSISNGINLAGKALLYLYTPTDWTTANMTFQLSRDGVTWSNVYYQTGSEFTITMQSNRVIVLNPADFAGIQWIRVRSGTGIGPILQTASRVFTLTCKAL